MIENSVVRNVPEMAQFIIDCLSDADFRTKMDEVPNVLESERSVMNTDDFLDMLESEAKFAVVSASCQNDSMLFVELVLKGDLHVSMDQMTRLKNIAES